MNPMERFLKAAQGNTVDRAPVWLMRQAGRYLPEYQAIRAQHDFLTMCKTPKLAAEISLQPWRRFGMDAVIFFCDILIPAEAMGIPLAFSEKGPKLGPLPATTAAVRSLRMPKFSADIPFVGETLSRLRDEIAGGAALIGFSGAPWTLATYCLAGGSTGNRAAVKEILHTAPDVLHALLDKLTDMTIAYLNYQIASGAQVVQVFDSWAGQLTADEYHELAFPYVKRIFQEVTGVPRILFCQKSAHLVHPMMLSGADVVSIGEDTAISEARTFGKVIQGNLSPELLRDGPIETIVETTRTMLRAGGNTGYIANLGHGVLKETPVTHVQAFVETVQSSHDLI